VQHDDFVCFARSLLIHPFRRSAN